MTDQPDTPGASDPPEPSTTPVAGPVPGPRQVTLRRAPRYRAFVTTGAVVGVVVAVLLYVVFAGDGEGDFSVRAIVGYLAVGLGLVGAVLGGLVAVLVERPRRPR